MNPGLNSSATSSKATPARAISYPHVDLPERPALDRATGAEVIDLNQAAQAMLDENTGNPCGGR